MEFIASQKKRLPGSRCKKLTVQIIGVGTPCHLAEVIVILVVFYVLRNVAKGRSWFCWSALDAGGDEPAALQFLTQIIAGATEDSWFCCRYSVQRQVFI